MSTPTPHQVAVAAAMYAVREFSSLDSWFTHEEELAGEWMKDAMFRCTVDYAIKRVTEVMRYNKHMQDYAAQVGGGAPGVARVVGSIVGEWTGGQTTIDRELGSW